MPYQADDYWEKLLLRLPDLRGVSYPELSLRAAEALYRQQARVVDRLLTKHAIAPGSVLDVGSGTGFWLAFWQARGAGKVTALELTDSASESLRAGFPKVNVLQGDVADGVPDGPFDAVSAMSVLLHIVDDARWRSAVTNLARALRPGGALILMEPAVRTVNRLPELSSEANSRARSLEVWRSALEEADCEIVGVAPVTVLQGNPVDARRAWQQRALEIWWWRYGRASRSAVGAALTGIVAALDRALTQSENLAPSAKVLLARRH